MNVPLTGGNPFLQGDANLDGQVDGQDFIRWNSNKFTTNSDWCGGNFNGDTSVDGQDFIIWNAFKFMSSDRLNRDRAETQWSGARGLTGGKGNHPERTGAAWQGRVTQQLDNVQRLNGIQASSLAETKLKTVMSVPQPDTRRLQSPAINLPAHKVRSFAETAQRRVTNEAIDSIFAELE